MLLSELFDKSIINNDIDLLLFHFNWFFYLLSFHLSWVLHFFFIFLLWFLSIDKVLDRLVKILFVLHDYFVKVGNGSNAPSTDQKEIVLNVV